MKRKIIFILLAICFALSLGSMGVLGSSILPFRDVRITDWYALAVEYVYSHGLMNGTSPTTFEPNGILTRAQVAQVLYNLEDTPLVSDTDSAIFSDVTDTEQCAPLPELMDRKKRDIMERKGDKEDENKRQKQQKESSAAAL